MSIASIVVSQRDFSAGVIDADARRRDDVKIFRAALREGTNMRSLNAGGMTDRPGSAFEFFDAGRPTWVRPESGVRHKVMFGNGRFTARSEANNIISDITDCPWTSSDLPNLRVAVAERWLVIACQGMRPQVLSWDGSAWSLEPFTFSQDLNGGFRQPFYRFAQRGVTLHPSGRSGPIDVTFSADVLLPGHVGASFLWHGKELRITQVIDARNGKANVLSTLPPARRFGLGDTSGFSIGDIVEGETSGTKGYVVNVGGSTIDYIALNNFNGFRGDEWVVGPDGQAKGTGSSGFVPGSGGSSNPMLATVPTEIWEEQFMSAERGWPGGVAYDRQRLIFFDFPAVPNAILWSEAGTIDAFQIGDEPADAILESVPISSRVLEVTGGADQFVLTASGAYYIPVSASTPIAPGTMEFRQISSDAIAPIPSANTSNGLIFVGAGGNRVMALVATGQTSRPYSVQDISRFHTALIRNPVQLAATSGDGEIAEGYLFVLNSDGTIASAKFNPDEEWVGFFPWKGVGHCRFIAADQGDLLKSVEYPGTASPVIEAMDDESLVDCAIAANRTTILEAFVGAEVALIQHGVYRGLFTIAAGGTIAGWDGGAEGVSVGFPFSARIQPYVANVDGGESVRQRLRPRRVKEAHAVLNSACAELIWCGRRHHAFPVLADEAQAPPARDMTLRGRVIGRSDQPDISLERPLPGRLKVLEFLFDVTV